MVKPIRVTHAIRRLSVPLEDIVQYPDHEGDAS
jgi:hypothetical protein